MSEASPSPSLSPPPPSGGMGGDEVDPSSLPFGPTATPLRGPSLVRRLVVLVGTVAVVGICGGVSMRVYVDRAKTMEARRSLRTIADLAKQAYDRDGKLCASASSPVPAEMPPSRKYTVSADEYARDAAAHAGFACLGFEGPPISYFQYSYIATAEGFTATARGKVHDDDRESVLTATGTLDEHGVLRLKKP